MPHKRITERGCCSCCCFCLFVTQRRGCVCLILRATVNTTTTNCSKQTWLTGDKCDTSDRRDKRGNTHTHTQTLPRCTLRMRNIFNHQLKMHLLRPHKCCFFFVSLNIIAYARLQSLWDTPSRCCAHAIICMRAIYLICG